MSHFSSLLSQSINHLLSEYRLLQIGRANASLVEGIQVESYGSMIPLNNVANISCPDAKTIRIEPWDKENIDAIEKAITNSTLNINPQNMGESILLPIPSMTEDCRKDIVKRVKELAEAAKISVRNARHTALKEVKKSKDDKLISEDEAKNQESDIEEQVQKTNKTIENTEREKEKEVMTV